MAGTVGTAVAGTVTGTVGGTVTGVVGGTVTGAVTGTVTGAVGGTVTGAVAATMDPTGETVVCTATGTVAGVVVRGTVVTGGDVGAGGEVVVFAELGAATRPFTPFEPEPGAGVVSDVVPMRRVVVEVRTAAVVLGTPGVDSTSGTGTVLAATAPAATVLTVTVLTVRWPEASGVEGGTTVDRAEPDATDISGSDTETIGSSSPGTFSRASDPPESSGTPDRSVNTDDGTVSIVSGLGAVDPATEGMGPIQLS